MKTMNINEIKPQPKYRNMAFKLKERHNDFMVIMDGYNYKGLFRTNLAVCFSKDGQTWAKSKLKDNGKDTMFIEDWVFINAMEWLYRGWAKSRLKAK